MSELDDRTLLRSGANDETVVLPTPPPRMSGMPVVIITIVGLLLGAAAAWWWTRDTGPATTAKPTGAAGTEGAVAPAGEARPLPPLDQMDTFLRALLGTLSSSPELTRWLATDDLIRQMANGIDRVSRGGSPARELGVLQPTGNFAVTKGQDEITVDPRSYQRFNGLATAISSLDAKMVADVYRTIQPRLNEAYKGLGRTDASVDAAVSTALQVLIDTPTLNGPARLVPGSGVRFVYADPKLEALAPAQKQLLRMGPENMARVQARLREIKAAIETPPTR